MNLPTYSSGILFSKAHKLVRQKIYTTLEQYHLNPFYWSILSVASQSPDGIRLAAVADQLGVTAPMVTTEANVLIEMRLIKRIPHHSDGRAKLLVITPKGKKLATIVEKALNQQVGQLLQGLSHDEVRTFQKALQMIVENSEKA